jgi:hypothetical protein
MSFDGQGKMIEGDSANMCAGKFPLALSGDQADGLACPSVWEQGPLLALVEF